MEERAYAEHSLYVTDVRIKSLMQTLDFDPETGEVANPDVVEELERLCESKDRYIEVLALEVKDLASQAAAIKAEEEALAERRQAKNARAERLQKVLLKILTADGKKSFETARCKMTVRSSQQTIIEDEAACLKYLKRMHKDALTFKDPAINKAAVKALIKAGVKVKGAFLKDSSSITVK